MMSGNNSHFDRTLQKKFEDLLDKKEALKREIRVTPSPNSYALFHERFKNHRLYEFEIYGENGKYKPVFAVDNGQIYSSCNCRHGRKDKSCRHRMQILLGNDKRLTSSTHINNYKLMIEEFKTSKASSAMNSLEYKLIPGKNGALRAAFSNLFFLFHFFF